MQLDSFCPDMKLLCFETAQFIKSEGILQKGKDKKVNLYVQ